MSHIVRFFILIALFISTLFAQESLLMTHPGSPPSNPTEGEGDEFENVLKRNQYWFERNAFPNADIPRGAYQKAIEHIRTKMSVYSSAGRSKILGAISKGMDSQIWKNIGPVNIGGRVIDIAINPKNPKTMYVCSADGGLWKTIDDAKSWFSVSDNFPIQTVGCVVINPIDTNIVYAGTGEAQFGGHMFDGMGIFKSTNGGASWQQVGASSIPPYVRVCNFAINPQNPNIIYAAIPEGTHGADEGGIWKTTDAGGTWTRVFYGITNDVIINPLDPNILYTASSKVVDGNFASNYGLFKTTDGGTTWKKMSVPLPANIVDSTIGRTSLSLCADQPNVIFAGMSELVRSGAKTRLAGIYKTTNSGDNWEKLSVPFDYMVSQGWYDNVIEVNPKNPDIVFAGGVKLIRTGDGGQTWERIPDQVQGGVLHVDQHAIRYNPINPDKVYIGDDGGVFRITQNGQLTEKVDYGLSITQFVGGAMHPTSDAYYLGGTQDNGTMNSSTAPDFDRIMFGDGGFTQINPKNPAIQFTTDWGLSLSKSNDFGHTWARALTGFPPNEGTMFYSPYAMDPVSPDNLYFGTSRIFKTTNSGKNWLAMNNCMFPTGTGYCYYVSAVSVSQWDNNYVLAGATGGMVGISSNGGTSWNIVTSGLPQRYCASVRSFKPGEIFAVHTGWNSDHVFVSTDYGNTWKSIQNNLPDIPVNDIFARGDTYIVGTDAGTFISTNKGANWEVLGDGMHTVSVQQLLYNENTGTLRAVTHGRGMYDLPFLSVTNAAPQFITRPDTTLLQPGQQFLYAAVAKASPPATFKLVEGSSSMTIDPTLGLVKWTAGDKVSQVTIEASNSTGKATQTFTLHTADVVPAFDWQVISSEKVPKRTMRLFNVDKNILWIGHDTGIVSRSTDGGKTWKRMEVTNTLAAIQDIFAFDDNLCFVTTEAGTIIKTTDGGTNWKKVYYGINARFGSIYFFDANKGITVTQGEKDSADILFTYDGGDTWIKAMKRPYSQQPIPGTLTFIDDEYGWFASSNRNSSPSDYAELLRTSDGGVTWFRAKSHCRHISSIAFIDNTTGFIVDRQAGIIEKVRNGGSAFTTLNLPMSGELNHTVQTFPGTNVVWIANNEKAWISRNGGTVWTPTTFVPTGTIHSAIFADTSFGWAVSYDGVVQQHTLNPMVSVSSKGKIIPNEIALHQNYPNPFSTSAVGNPLTTIRFTIPSRMEVKLKIFSALGNELTELVNEVLDAGEYYVTWNASTVSTGTYFYQLSAGSAIITKSMVVVR